MPYTPNELQTLYDYNHLVPLYLWSGLITLLGSAGAINAAQLWHGRRRRRLAGHYALTLQQAMKGCSRTGKKCTRWLAATILSIFRKYSIRESRIAHSIGMMNLGQVLLIICYFAFNLGLCLGGAYRDISWQAHHAARLCSASLPLLIGLASKNNLISYLTGYTYESLNVFHRWIARIIFLLATIHIAGRVHAQDPPTTTHGKGQVYIRWGIAAYIAMGWLVFMSWRPIRNAKYSFFLICHVLAVMTLLVSLWVHRPQMKGWVAAAVGVYFLDRAWRTLRVGYYQLVRKMPSGTADEPVAWVECLSKETIRVVRYFSIQNSVLMNTDRVSKLKWIGSLDLTSIFIVLHSLCLLI